MLIHVPRTGGTTLTSLLRRHLPRYMRLSTKDDFQAFFALPQEDREALDFLSGHMPFGVDAFLTQPVRYVVWLRDPVERMISSYFHARSVPGNLIYDYANSVSLLEYSRNAWTVFRENAQTRMLMDIDFRAFAADPFKVIMSLPLGAMTETMLASAQRNIERATIGLYEQFGESVARTCRIIGVRDTDVPYLNGASRTEEVDDATRASIRKFHEMDYRLYEHAKMLFQKEDASRHHGRGTASAS